MHNDRLKLCVGISHMQEGVRERERDSLFGIATSKVPQPLNSRTVWRSGRTITGEGKPKHTEKGIQQTTTNPKWSTLVLKPGLRLN
jgi:hypothetical protein